jgi:hypothetical protein
MKDISDAGARYTSEQPTTRPEISRVAAFSLPGPQGHCTAPREIATSIPAEERSYATQQTSAMGRGASKQTLNYGRDTSGNVLVGRCRPDCETPLAESSKKGGRASRRAQPIRTRQSSETGKGACLQVSPAWGKCLVNLALRRRAADRRS